MRNLKRSIIVFSWLSGVASAQNIESRGLSDALSSILGPGHEGGANQIEKSVAGGGQGGRKQPVITTIAIHGLNGTISTAIPVDGVYVSRSIAGTMSGSDSAAAAATIHPSAMIEPVTTLPSTVKVTYVVTVPPPAAVVHTTVMITETTHHYATYTAPAAPMFEIASPPPIKLIEPPISAPPPVAPISMTALPSVVIVTEPPPAASSPAMPAPAPPAASPPSPPVVPGALGLTTGQGILRADGTCGCSCNCDGAAFPAMPPPAAAPAPDIPALVSNGTTLQTIITPPTSSVSLPSSILVDTSAPPPPPGAEISSTTSSAAAAGPATTTATTSSSSSEASAASSATESSSAQASTTTSSDTASQSSAPASSTSPETPSASVTPSEATPPEAPAQQTAPSAASSIRFSLIGGDGGSAQPTAAPDLSQAQSQIQPVNSIDISKFTLVSSLILGNLGD